MTGMDDLATWLRAQLDDDDRVAQQMIAEPAGFYIEAETVDVNIMTVGAHVYRWTPKRALDEAHAKRRILDALEPEAMGNSLDARFHAHLIRLLALPYADREGYREEWRP
jgi:hypothetical protein